MNIKQVSTTVHYPAMYCSKNCEHSAILHFFQHSWQSSRGNAKNNTDTRLEHLKKSINDSLTQYLFMTRVN